MDNSFWRNLSVADLTAELRTGCLFEPEIVCEVLEHSISELRASGKGADHLPFLFENGLMDYATRVGVNREGDENYV